MGEFFLIVEFQLINVEGIVEIEYHHLAKHHNHHCFRQDHQRMLKLVGKSLMRKRKFIWSSSSSPHDTYELEREKVVILQ